MIRMTEEQRAEFLRSTSLDIALMRTRFDEIDEQKIYEKGQRLGKKIGECIGRRQGEHIGRQQGEYIGRQQGELIGRTQRGSKTKNDASTNVEYPDTDGEEEAELLQQLNGDELLLLSERYERIKTSEDLTEQVHEIVNQRMNANDQFNQSLKVRSL